MASWHIIYFKLKKFEEMEETGRSFCFPLPLTLLPCNTSKIVKKKHLPILLSKDIGMPRRPLTDFASSL